MSFIQSEFSEYTLSHDELMLKELERRDGIYSFIFHELETPKDVLSLEDSIELQKHFVNKQKQLIKVEETSEGGNADEIEEKLQLQQCTCNIEEADTLVYKTTASSSSSTSTSSASSPLQTTEPASPPALPLTSSSLINTKITTTTTATTTSTSKLCETNINSNNILTTFKEFTCEYLKTWQPPSACLSLPLPLSLTQQTTGAHLPFTMYDHSKLYNFVATGGFRVRIPTPRFSHVSAPLVRNRRHTLKETPQYKNFNKSINRVPDLRELFPHDPDVHAPFVEMSNNNERSSTDEEENLNTHIIL